MTREEMKDVIVRNFGFENEKTIYFFAICESFAECETNDKLIGFAFSAIMNDKKY